MLQPTSEGTAWARYEETENIKEACHFSRFLCSGLSPHLVSEIFVVDVDTHVNGHDDAKDQQEDPHDLGQDELALAELGEAADRGELEAIL